jgi:hypothetical protein
MIVAAIILCVKFRQVRFMMLMGTNSIVNCSPAQIKFLYMQLLNKDEKLSGLECSYIEEQVKQLCLT